MGGIELSHDLEATAIIWIITARPGDVITCPPGKKHWHGATATTAMSHIAIQEHDENGQVVKWLEKVTDEQYLG